MRTWRVGTISMAMSLIMSGIMLLLSQWGGGWSTSSMDTFFMWWPVIFILLGAEIIIYQVRYRKEQSNVKYDIFSIAFIGLLGMVCLGFVALTSTGLMQEIRYTLEAVESSRDIPEVQEELPTTVKRVVVRTEDYMGRPLLIEGTTETNVHLFGTYSSYELNLDQETKINSRKFVSLQTVGDTVYVTLKRPSSHNGFERGQSRVQWTVVLPKSLKVELDLGGNKVNYGSEGKPQKWNVIGG